MHKISFSQYQMWKNCPFRWKLNYIDKLGMREPGIALVFGTAMHEVLQSYIETLYSKTIKAANDMPLNDMLMVKMVELYKKSVEENNNVHYSTSSELSEYYNDGVQIIKWFKAHRDVLFMKKDWELVGIEVAIDVVPSKDHPTVRLVGFLDLIMKHVPTNQLYIYDFKTSTNGWGKYEKTDKTKVSQLVLYKTFYSKQFNIPPENITVEYIILKRKINENAEFPVMKRRVQRFEPAHGKQSQSYIVKEIQSFISSNFNTDGSINENALYVATTGKNNSSCKFCEFKDKHDICDPKKRRSE